MKYNEVVLTSIGSLSIHGRSGDRPSSTTIDINIHPKDESSSISGYVFTLPQNQVAIYSFDKTPHALPLNKTFFSSITTSHVSGISGFIDPEPDALLNISSYKKNYLNSILSTTSTDVTTDASITNGTSYRKLFVNIASGGLIVSDTISSPTYNQNYSSISNFASNSIQTNFSGTTNINVDSHLDIDVATSFNTRQETETEISILTDEISGASGRLSTFSNDYATPYIYSRNLTLQSGFSGIYVHEAEIVGVVDTSYHHPTNYKTGEPCPEAQLGALVGNQTPCSGRPPSIVYRRNNISV
jgi:hypothetical protein